MASFLLYVFSGCPAFTVEEQYRRAEKANLVGPAEILGTVELKDAYSVYDRLLLADDGEGVIMYLYRADDISNHRLVYREKMGEVTVPAAPSNDVFWWGRKEIEVPVLVFDSCPAAVRAELELELGCEFNGEEFQKTYSLESYREKQGYFLFSIRASASYELGAEGCALSTLAQVSGHDFASYVETAIPATVRLYDEAGAKVYEKSLYIRSVAGEAHEARGDAE